MIRKRFLRVGLAIVLVVLLLPHTIWGSTGGVTNVGAFVTHAEYSNAGREWVELVGTKGLLTGRPEHPLVKLITVYAPGVNRGHLILRELETRDAKQSFLLTAPDNITRQTERVTLYLNDPPKDLVLFEKVGEEWKKRLPQPFAVDAVDLPEGRQAETKKIVAFSAQGLGFYWFARSTTPNSLVLAHVPPPSSAQSLIGGSLSLGMFPSMLWILLFVVVGWISHWVHNTLRFSEQ